MGVREIDRFLEQWEMNVKDVHRRAILAPHAEGEGALAGHLAAGPRLDGRDGGGPGAGPAYHRAVGCCLRRRRGKGLIFEQTGGSPPPLDETQQAELKEAVLELPQPSSGIGHGQLELENGSTSSSRERFGVRLSRSSCLNYLHRLGFAFKRPKKRLA